MEIPRFVDTKTALAEFSRAAEKVLADAVDRLNGQGDGTRKTWLTNDEACEYLGLSRPTLARYRADGTLPYSKLGGSVYYRREDIEALLEQRMVSP